MPINNRRHYLVNRVRNKDMRNAYGSKGGYVRDYNSDYRGNGYRNDYSEYDYRNDYRDYGSNTNRDFRYNREHNGVANYEMYGNARIMPMDFRRNDYAMDYSRDYAMEDEEYRKDLKHWIEKLKKKDRFGVSKDQVLRQASNMQIKFEDFEEDEFYATYLMLVSDFPKIANDYNQYISMAKSWLEDDDVEMKGGDKLCAYLYTIVLGKDD